jgi:predicted aldo/keto reductase-like oxidoreductase
LRYKEYGKTGKKVSVIGFGGMRFKKEDYTQSLDICAEMVRKASELGINYFDTAPVHYCGGYGEKIFGEAFKNMPNPFYVSTKSIFYDDPTADDVRKRIEESLKLLNVDKIHFYHMWNILSLRQYDKIMAPGGPYEGAVKAKEEGLIDHIVASTHCTGDEIEKIVNDDVFEGLTVGYNVLNFAFRRKGIIAAYKKNMGIATMNPLGGGIIAENPQMFSFIKEDENDTIAQAALKFNASQKEVTISLSGISSMEQLLENVKAGDYNQDMTEKRLNEIAAKLNEELDTLCTGCGYCRDCPSEIAIPKFMDAYNYYILNKNEKEVKTRMKMHWGIKPEKGQVCIECGKCEEQCTQHLPIIERLKFVSNIK